MFFSSRVGTSISSDSETPGRGEATGSTASRGGSPAATLIRSHVFDGTGEIAPPWSHRRSHRRADLAAPEGVIDATGLLGHARVPRPPHALRRRARDGNPSLDESLRHGVTTVLVGSCGLSRWWWAIPRTWPTPSVGSRASRIDLVLPILRDVVDWNDARRATPSTWARWLSAPTSSPWPAIPQSGPMPWASAEHSIPRSRRAIRRWDR
jgi:hypothetical protein